MAINYLVIFYIFTDGIPYDPTFPTFNNEDTLTPASIYFVLNDEGVDGIGSSQGNISFLMLSRISFFSITAEEVSTSSTPL